MKASIIYILLNPIFPNYLKIGVSQNSSTDERFREMYSQNNSALPSEYIVAYEKEVSDYEVVGKEIFHALNIKRQFKTKDFYYIPLKDAVRFIERIIEGLEKRGTIKIIKVKDEEFFDIKNWWFELSFVWKQIFRSHIDISYDPTENDLLRAVHNVIDNCQDTKLRQKVAILIVNKKYTKNLFGWYENMSITEKKLFNTFLPYDLNNSEIKDLLRLEIVDCKDNISVIDLQPLTRLNNLQSINCSNTNISNLDSLTNAYSLKNISMNHTYVDNINPLYNLPYLEEVVCISTELNVSTIESFKKEKPNCIIQYESFLDPNNTPKYKTKKVVRRGISS